MKKNIFLLPDEKGKINPDLVAKVAQNLGKKFAKTVFFTPIADEKNTKDFEFAFDAKTANEMLSLGREKELVMGIIDFAKKLDLLNDMVVVVGCADVGIFSATTLSLKIASALNSALIITNPCEINSAASLSLAKEFGLEPLGVIKENGKNLDELLGKFDNFAQNIVTPYSFENMLYEMAAKDVKTVVLPESFDERILRAADTVLKSGAVKIVLLGNKDEIEADAKKYSLNLSKAIIIDNQTDTRLEQFATTLYELRKEKGMTQEKAATVVKDRTFFATMMVYCGEADAMVSGASTTTADTIRPALQTIKMKPGVSTVSGSFIMCMKDKLWLFADCAITPNPTAEQLAGIALSSAKTAEAFGIKPKIAMLSYSTGTSGSGADVDFTNEALNLAREICKDYDIDGPLQFDASVSKSVAKKKMPDSKVAGEANVFIFPNLNCGNICYKAVQRSSGAVAIGPILQGLKKPINDLSRGCLVEDIVNTILISAIQAKGN